MRDILIRKVKYHQETNNNQEYCNAPRLKSMLGKLDGFNIYYGRNDDVDFMSSRVRFFSNSYSDYITDCLNLLDEINNPKYFTFSCLLDKSLTFVTENMDGKVQIDHKYRIRTFNKMFYWENILESLEIDFNHYKRVNQIRLLGEFHFNVK